MRGTDQRPEHPSRVLVTGATGFIGRRLVPALGGAGYRVRALVRRPPADGFWGEPVEVFPGDLVRPESLEGVERNVDIVVHCASLLGKWGSDDELLREVNVRGPLRLLERFRGSGLRRFVHLSAGGVTGPLPDGPVDETYACKPATAYERTKLLGEQEVLRRSAELGLTAVVARPTFTYGPGDPHKLALFRAVKKGRYAFIGDGESVNHPVFIEDLIAGLLLVLENGKPGEIYIIGGERPVTKRELVNAIADALGVDRPRLAIPLWFARLAAAGLEVVGRTLRFEPILTRSRVMMMADNFGYTIAKARAELGYEPATDLRDGIEVTVDSYRKAGKL